jgi:hypothetical protein
MTKRHEVNKMIINEIDSLDIENYLKKFLKDLLYFEIGNIGETNQFRFSEEYEKMIFKALKEKSEKT